MPKRVTEKELQALKLWLQNNEVQYKNMHRDFSDAVLLANLIKKLYPKLVDMHNYPSRNNTQLKLINWETINQKVLSKLGLQQSKTMLDKLARCVAGAIEALLCDIMLLEREQKAKGDRGQQEQEQAMEQNEEIMTITVNKSIGDAIIQVPQKMILYSIYEQVLRESQSKDAIIKNCQQKITHLENVLKLKGERIEELCAQLAKMGVSTLSNIAQSGVSSGNNAGTVSCDDGIKPCPIQNQSQCQMQYLNPDYIQNQDKIPHVEQLQIEGHLHSEDQAQNSDQNQDQGQTKNQSQNQNQQLSKNQNPNLKHHRISNSMPKRMKPLLRQVTVHSMN